MLFAAFAGTLQYKKYGLIPLFAACVKSVPIIGFKFI